MELRAAIEGLQLLPSGAAVQVFTTSDYLFQGATKWIHGWRRRDWQKRGGKPVANADLWQALDALLHTRRVRWINAKANKVESPGLDEASRLAVAAIDVA
jgi:ribonuclease HI